jgi:hypothetical protein
MFSSGPIVDDVFNFFFPFFFSNLLKERYLAREQEKRKKKGQKSKSTKHGMGSPKGRNQVT